jgi:hypothetical protein
MQKAEHILARGGIGTRETIVLVLSRIVRSLSRYWFGLIAIVSDMFSMYEKELVIRTNSHVAMTF